MIFRPALLALALFALAGCSVKKIAVNKLGSALAGSGTTFAFDDDPDLIRDAVPFSLKLMESLLAENPRHHDLLVAACSGFTQYAYAFVQEDADEVESQDLERATVLRSRARRLYTRARNYCLQSLALKRPAFEQALRSDPRGALRTVAKRDVAALYWTAASWGALIALSKDKPEVVADQPIVEALIDRALELDESFDQGAIHNFLITYEPARPGGKGDPAERSRQHFERAAALSHGHDAGPLVIFAEVICVQEQDRRGFEDLLKRALAIDPDAAPERKLANLVMLRRARWLLSRADELFVEKEP
jgi:predicted anti-sigma-YlaC factor YlaD